MIELDPWWLEHLVCPVDKQRLEAHADGLRCASGHSYRVVDGVPVMLLREWPQTISLAHASLNRAENIGVDTRAPDLHLESLGISEDEKRRVVELSRQSSAIDPVVAFLIAASNGLMYRHLIGALDRYPIPVLPLPRAEGKLLIDIGCSWGRWTFAANDAGYAAVGLDPSLGAVMAARRVAASRGSRNRYVVGDARYLPFAEGTFDAAFSYSVLQHFPKTDAAAAITEIGRVLRRGGTAKVQLPTTRGLRCLYHQARRGFREPVGFEVRYWEVAEIHRVMTKAIGQVTIDVDGYFGIGLQPADRPFMTPTLRAILTASEALKAISRGFRPLVTIADSVFATATRPAMP
ncbi:MAG TPA: methyltransferase domain-containing protein [Vicinamibacterales bacterium]|nr:methyltransferase domain-containing protein [Vicinamibacterales bacterium]